jgi:argininosuccinate lyase
VADLLVVLGVPFREAHGVVAGLVREALDSGRSLSSLTDAELAAHSSVLAANGERFRAVLAAGSWLESKVSEGGTASARLSEQLALAHGALDDAGAER